MQQNFYVGIVENRRDDPLKLGRCQVRVFGVHTEQLEDIPTSALPWAIPLMPATSASISGIGHSGSQYLEGSQVFLFFQDGESKQQPIILGGFHGIPVSQSPFGTNNQESDSVPTIVDSKVTSSVRASSDTSTADTTGMPVEDAYGDPVDASLGPPPVDISKMVYP